MRAYDTYLDQVQEAVEAHPTWDVDEILRYVFEKWTKQDPETFVSDIVDEMRAMEANAALHPWEARI